MIMINEEQVSFKGNEIKIQAEFTLLCRKIKEILKAIHGEERAEEIFNLMIETNAKTDEEIEEEIKTMISKEKRRKLHQILDMVLDINSTKANTFFNFSGHVDVVQVDVHKEGWERFIGPDFKEMVYLTHKESLNNCNSLVRKLKEIKRELKEDV